MRATSAVRGGLSVALLLLGSSVFAVGCPQTTCEEKAICPEPAGGPGGPDAHAATGVEGGALLLDGATCAEAEDCTNGIDDDCNGAIDCADPACSAGFVCIALPPAGWSGPGILYEGTGGGGEDAPSAADCPPAFPTDAFDGTRAPTAPAAACTCSCAPPAGVTCAVGASFYYDSACANLCETEPLALNACVATCSGAQTMMVVESVTATGSCAPQGTSQVTPPVWGSTARICASSPSLDAPGGCPAGQACVAKPPTGFDSGGCLWQSGDIPCPDASATRKVYLTGATDTRGCSACTCSAPNGVTCASTSVTTFSDAACTDTLSPVIGDGSCVSAPGGAHAIEATTSTTAAQGSCTPSVATPLGSFTPTGATTICCSP
jgi:hypothetical protein